ncbi:D-alanyl-lipoteichoic acid biosynthesis protein DltD [Weissella diestrammenae]|uniref:Protein DltD n=1 Tax=Weissella diestrammenae TaxID=1162633 RepID=A0A7G9T6L5_9LACO|nr:D-alanyl-lipoteichoic acid biosynthesis protein DltD [Weissella diestrammenae]MCM0582981.1 D-alanyl-lipoteichoic acid biosynthesis protein DltD [Weissella diestrammenae]QNN75740.1 D-alanyl-lipoteichoic acid biosynthesis protein DltD [Weissella diestrammenae]
MFKRLWLIFGPVLVAIGLVITVIFLVPTTQSHDLDAEKRAATSLTPIVFKNAALKRQALSDKQHRFVPFFGSSEWQRFDEMHPSVLAEGYHRNYRPFLLGLKGAESLTHYFGMQQIKQQLKNKQAVFVISPQWFIREGQFPGAFEYYYSGDQAYHFLQNVTGSVADRYAAQRFLKMMPESSVRQYMEKVAHGKALSAFELRQINLLEELSDREDSLFAGLQTGNNFTKRVQPRAQKLPQSYNVTTLKARATRLGEEQTTNNPFEILNSFYSKRVKRDLPKLKDSQKNFNYLKSPEYGDLQLVLNEFAKNKTDVMFVIPPVNTHWQAYTGLNADMYEKTVEKIRYQLQSQGFDQITDLSKRGSEPYFMQDTIHLGWNGWLAFDQRVNHFLTTHQATPNYHLNNHFFTQQWAQTENIPNQD